MFALAFFGIFLEAAFIRKELQQARLRATAICIALIGSVAALSPLAVRSISPRHDSRHLINGYNIVPGPLSWVVGVAILLLAGLLIGRFVSAHRHADESAKKPLRIILRTVVVVTAIIIPANVLLPFISSGSQSANLVSNLAILALILVIAFSVLRYKFLDIRIIVVRAIAYLTTLFATTLLLILPIVLLFGHFLDFHPSTAKLATVVILSGLAVYIVQYLRAWFDKLTNKVFFRHYYDPQEVLDRLGKVLVETIDIDVLRDSTAQIIAQALKPTSFTFLLLNAADKKERALAEKIQHTTASTIIDVDEMGDGQFLELLNKHNIDLLLELSTNQEKLGYLALGHKQSGDAYSLQDRRLLGIVADEIGIAIQNALRFEEIEKFNETLQEKIDDATRKLRRTNEKLKLLDETKDDFISMASHQLRTPLTSVKGYVSMVLDGDAGKLSSMQRKLLSQSFISAQRMVYLISDLLNVSRLRTGKFVIEPTASNLAKVIRDEIDQLQETAKGRNLTLTYNHPEHFPMLMIDETKMRQVIMNFIDNAIYYTPSGGHIVANLLEKPQTIEFTVTDDGIGVPRAEQHHLFSKFYRAANAKRARPDGTGLGLFMAKKVIIAQGGAVIFKSQEHKGSVFGFSFAKNRLLPENQTVITTNTGPSK